MTHMVPVAAYLRFPKRQHLARAPLYILSCL